MSKGPNMPLILNLIRNDDDFRKSLVSTFSKIKKSVESFKDNPRCKCRGDIVRHFDKGGEDIEKFLEGWSEKHTHINEKAAQSPIKQKTSDSLDEPRKPARFKNMAGNVVEIDADPQAFKDLMTHAKKERWRYAAFNVMEKEKDGKTVWLVFFG